MVDITLPQSPVKFYVGVNSSDVTGAHISTDIQPAIEETTVVGDTTTIYKAYLRLFNHPIWIIKEIQTPTSTKRYKTFGLWEFREYNVYVPLNNEKGINGKYNDKWLLQHNRFYIPNYTILTCPQDVNAIGEYESIGVGLTSGGIIITDGEYSVPYPQFNALQLISDNNYVMTYNKDKERWELILLTQPPIAENTYNYTLIDYNVFKATYPPTDGWYYATTLKFGTLVMQPPTVNEWSDQEQ